MGVARAGARTVQLSCQVAEVLNADLWASQLLSEEQRATQQAGHPLAAPTALPGAGGPIPVGTYVGQISFPAHYLLGIRSVEEDEIALTVAPDGTVERVRPCGTDRARTNCGTTLSAR
jgi:hypothetical protein